MRQQVLVLSRAKAAYKFNPRRYAQPFYHYDLYTDKGLILRFLTHIPMDCKAKVLKSGIATTNPFSAFPPLNLAVLLDNCKTVSAP